MSSPKDKDHENIFEILDGMMSQLNKTKKMFMIMILSVLILPPIAMLVMVQVFDPPYEERYLVKEMVREELGLPPKEPLEGEEAELKQEFKEALKAEKHKTKLLKPPQLVITIISLVWLGIGIRQWFVLSKWDKRYQQFKAKQEEIDKKLDDDSDGEEK